MTCPSPLVPPASNDRVASRVVVIDRRTRRHRRLVGLACACVMVLAACGGDDDAEPADGSSGASPTATVVVEPTGTVGGDPTPTVAVAAPTADEPPVAYALALAPDGLTLVEAATGSTTSLPFGTDDGSVVQAIQAALGPPDQQGAGTEECPNGQSSVAGWNGDLQVDFDAAGAFLSWSLDPGSTLTTLTGVGLGSALADLEAGLDPQIIESTLGNEFSTVSGLGGLLDGDDPSATIVALWGGPICAFR